MPSCTYYFWDGAKWNYLGSGFVAKWRYDQHRLDGTCTAVVHHLRDQLRKSLQVTA